MYGYTRRNHIARVVFGAIDFISTPKANKASCFSSAEGPTAPLEISADSVNEIKRAMRLLAMNGSLVPQCPHPPEANKAEQEGWSIVLQR